MLFIIRDKSHTDVGSAKMLEMLEHSIVECCREIYEGCDDPQEAARLQRQLTESQNSIWEDQKVRDERRRLLLEYRFQGSTFIDPWHLQYNPENDIDWTSFANSSGRYHYRQNTRTDMFSDVVDRIDYLGKCCPTFFQSENIVQRLENRSEMTSIENTLETLVDMTRLVETMQDGDWSYVHMEFDMNIQPRMNHEEIVLPYFGNSAASSVLGPIDITAIPLDRMIRARKCGRSGRPRMHV